MTQTTPLRHFLRFVGVATGVFLLYQLYAGADSVVIAFYAAVFVTSLLYEVAVLLGDSG